MASHEFIKCQGTKLLTSLPADVRHSLRHYEVAAVIRPFQPRPPLHGAAVPRQFCYAAVTDWSLLLLAMSAEGEAAVLLEIPLLMIEDLDVESLDVADVVNDARGVVRSSCISIYPKQTRRTPASTAAQQRGQGGPSVNPVQQQSQQQPRSGSPSSPLQMLKQAFTTDNSSPPPRKFRINQSALVRPPTPEETQRSEWQAAAAAVAPEFQRHMTAGQQQEQQQRRLTQSIMQQLQMPVLHWQQQLQSRKQQPGGLRPSAGPMAEAIEHVNHTTGAVSNRGNQLGLSHGGEFSESNAGAGVQVPSSRAPWSLINQNTAGHSYSSNQTNSSIARLKQRLTSDAVLAAPQSATPSAAEQAAVQDKVAVATVSSSDGSRKGARLKQRLTVDTAATQPSSIANTPQPTTYAALHGAQSTVPTAMGEGMIVHPRDPQPEQESEHPRSLAPLQVTQQPLQLQYHGPGQQQQQGKQRLEQPAPAATVDSNYCLQLITVERSSGLFFHIQRAWIGANMRAALSAAGAPGELPCV
eukprot:GHUV01029700.1.p1 GENE.GHUV01029700.1~~GHUV01029700.1.p1  ORF type:complete len:525 (+),score=192.69 GHUV01029700.1:287-1861(+)